MSDDQFTKLFKYIEGFRSDFEHRFENIDLKIDRLTSSVDALSKRFDTHEIELISRDRQFNRLVDWAREVGTKVGVPLKKL